MNTVANRQIICEVLSEQVSIDPAIVVLCSDSRGSASMKPFADAFPEHFVEIGIAEQNLVSVAAGMASCGRKAFAISPACFLSTRSYEQCKVDVAYSDTNVKLIGISGGISYGALGMTHHSSQDIACMAALPNMRVYLPSDRFQTEKLFKALLKDEKAAYVRVGRNPVPDVYSEDDVPFSMDKATIHDYGDDILIVATGEMVHPAVEAAKLLKQMGIGSTVLDMYCLKPIDKQAILDGAAKAKAVITVEEHVPFGGLGAMVSQILSTECNRPLRMLSLPDAPVITGTSKEVFQHYGLDAHGIVKSAKNFLKELKGE
ncbi:MAG TPA: transketolase family protein [Clostridiaceae bacterium]|nr:transketolase family protein [Clostridiaceae bacterium]